MKFGVYVDYGPRKSWLHLHFGRLRVGLVHLLLAGAHCDVAQVRKGEASIILFGGRGL